MGYLQDKTFWFYQGYSSSDPGFCYSVLSAYFTLIFWKILQSVSPFQNILVIFEPDCLPETSSFPKLFYLTLKSKEESVGMTGESLFENYQHNPAFGMKWAGLDGIRPLWTGWLKASGNIHWKICRRRKTGKPSFSWAVESRSQFILTIKGIERIFPFDILPTSLLQPNGFMETGIKQRLKALNLFSMIFMSNKFWKTVSFGRTDCQLQ